MVLITTPARKNEPSRVLHTLALMQTKRAPKGARSRVLLKCGAEPSRARDDVHLHRRLDVGVQ